MFGMLDWAKPIIEFVRMHSSLILPGLAGVAVTFLTSEKHSIKMSLARIGAGLFCAVVFTDPLLKELGRDPQVYRTAVAGLLAMTGFQIVRALSTMTLDQMGSIIRSIRGGSK